MTPDDATLIANEVRYLTQRFDEQARRTEDRFDRLEEENARHFKEVKDKQDRTNGRVTALEGWKIGVQARLSLLAATGGQYVAPIITGVVTAAAVALLFH